MNTSATIHIHSGDKVRAEVRAVEGTEVYVLQIEVAWLQAAEVAVFGTLADLARIASEIQESLAMINASVGGTIIAGTARPEELGAAFVAKLRDLALGANDIDDLLSEIAREAQEQHDSEADYWRSDAGGWALAELADALDAYAPNGYRFGLREEHGDEYGFWPAKAEEETA